MARYSRGRSAGYDAALRHIEEYEKLSRELGGTVEDVKEWLFSLPPSQLNPILDDYERDYGSSARKYAEESGLPGWKSGRKKMSGMVAERLFNLLPPRMPVETKFRLSENLWKHYGPKSHEVIRVLPTVAAEDLIEKASAHFEKCIGEYRIPEQLSNRFRWLTGGDVTAQEQLLNHLMKMERNFVLGFLPLKISSFLASVRKGQDAIQHARETIQIGKHQFEINIDAEPSRGKQKETRPIGTTAEEINWIGRIFVCLVLVLIAWLAFGGAGKNAAKHHSDHFRTQRTDAEDAAAMSKRGWGYYSGDGVTQDYAEAVRWWRKAAEAGDGSAMYNLGVMYNNGQGVARDMDAAAGWVFKALRAGYGFALKTTTNNTKWRSRAFRRSLQKRLRDAGYYSGQIDGLFGPGTKRAIKAAFRRQQ